MEMLIGYRYMLGLRPDKMESVSIAYEWVPGWNRSFGKPEHWNAFGLYHYKKAHEQQLMIGVGMQVVCELAGQVVEHEKGYRAEYARVVSVVRFYNPHGLKYYSTHLKANGVGTSQFAGEQYRYWVETGIHIWL